MRNVFTELCTVASVIPSREETEKKKKGRKISGVARVAEKVQVSLSKTYLAMKAFFPPFFLEFLLDVFSGV